MSEPKRVNDPVPLDPPDILFIKTLVATPAILIVGVALISSLKAAVIVTVSDAAKKLSSSVSDRVKVGAVVS